jgi:hypothetical protein
LHWATLAAVIALVAQWLFFVVRWRPAERFWRVGFVFAGLMTFLSTPVWEGYPGAATRVLLPLTLAFNVLLPRGRRWLPWFVIGNLTVAASVFEFSPPQDFYRVRGDAAGAVQLSAKRGWYGAERHLDRRWRWSSGESELRLNNTSGRALRVTLQARASAAGENRSVRVLQGERLLWGERVGADPVPVRFGFELPPGETVLRVVSDKPAEKVGTDPRPLAFRIDNLEIVLGPAGAAL